MRFDDFYADPRRSGSPERSLGPGWISDDEDGVAYTVYWIEQTGELYGVRHEPVIVGPGAPKPYGAYLPTASAVDERREVLLLGTVGRETYVEIEGRAESLPATERSLGWLAARIQEEAPPGDRDASR